MSSWPRFFIWDQNPLQIGNEYCLSAADSHHAFKVLRLQKDHRVEISDGKGNSFQALITSAKKDAVVVYLEDNLSRCNEPFAEINLIQGLLKGGKMDTVIHQAVELGVARIYPLLTARSVPDLPQNKVDAKIGRWQKIARESAALSKRSVIPKVEYPLSLAQLTANLHPEGELAFVFWEGVKDNKIYFGEDNADLQPKTGHPAQPPQHTPQDSPSRPSQIASHLSEQSAPRSPSQSTPHPTSSSRPPITVIVGPEGGFSAEEVQYLEQHKVRPAGLGPRILRAETAAVVALTLIQSRLGDLH